MKQKWYHINMNLFSIVRKNAGYTRESAADEDLQITCAETGATPIKNCTKGDIITAFGVINTVTMRPRSGTPAVEVDLYDGSGHLLIVWLGRRQISGIEVGRSVTIYGRITCEGEAATIYNPRYALRPRGET